MLNMGGKTGAYDLVFAREVWIPEYVSSGYLHALNDYVNDPALTGKDFHFADFAQSLIQSDTGDSKLYGIPTFVQTPLVVFNKEVFGTMGVQTPKTWDDTLSIATKLSQQGTGIALPAKEGLAAVDIWFALARSNNGGYFDAAGRLNLVTPENIATCTFWKDLVAVSMRGSTNWHFDDVNKAVQFVWNHHIGSRGPTRRPERVKSSRQNWLRSVAVQTASVRYLVCLELVCDSR